MYIQEAVLSVGGFRPRGSYSMRFLGGGGGGAGECRILAKP